MRNREMLDNYAMGSVMVEKLYKKKVLVGNPTHLELNSGINENELIYLIMDLPFTCNYDCLKCYRAEDVYIEDLDLELRKKVINEAKDLGAQVIVIPGEGEPLFHKAITKELVSYNSSLGLITILYTNGSLLDEETTRFLFDNDVTLIASVDSFIPNVYKELTGGEGDIEKVKENLEVAKNIYRSGIKRNNGTTETRLGMITIVTQQNREEIPALREWCNDEVFYICNFPIKEGNATENWDKLVGNNLPELIEISHRYTETGYAGLTTPLSDGRCAALYNGITIDTNGDVQVCPASVKTRVGNIKNECLEKLWQKIRDYATSQNTPLCIARDGKDKTFRYHDGNVVQHL